MLHRHHINLVKFSDPDDNDYRAILHRLQECVSNIPVIPDTVKLDQASGKSFIGAPTYDIDLAQ